MRSLLIRLVIIALAFAVTAKLLGGMSINGGLWGYVWVSVLFAVVNLVVGTFLKIITLPLTIITLGLFLIVVNAIVLEVTDALTHDLTIDSFFWTAIWASIIMSVTTVVLDYAFRGLATRK